MPQLQQRPTITRDIPETTIRGGGLQVGKRQVTAEGPNPFLQILSDVLLGTSAGVPALQRQQLIRKQEENELFAPEEEVSRQRSESAFATFKAQTQLQQELLRQIEAEKREETRATTRQKELETRLGAQRKEFEDRLSAQEESQRRLFAFQKEQQERALTSSMEKMLLLIEQRGKPTEDEVNTLADALERGELSPSLVPANARAKVTSVIHNRGGVIMTPKQREAVQGVLKVQGTIAEIRRISSKVNTAGGGIAPAVGLGRSIARMAGLDPDAAQLNALRITLGPLARSISAEVGVLTDRDINRVEAAVPKITDSREVAQAKLAVLQSFAKIAEQIATTTPGLKMQQLKERLEQWRGLADNAAGTGEATHVFNPATGKLEKK